VISIPFLLAARNLRGLLPGRCSGRRYPEVPTTNISTFKIHRMYALVGVSIVTSPVASVFIEQLLFLLLMHY